MLGFPGGSVVKNLPANIEDMGPSLVWEDSTGCQATKPKHHNCWACAPEPWSGNYWAHVLQLRKPMKPKALLCTGKSLQWETHAQQLEGKPQLEKSLHNNDDSVQSNILKNKNIFILITEPLEDIIALKFKISKIK